MVDIATWEQRKLPEIVERQTSMSDNALLPNIEFEDIVAGSGKLNKDVSKKKTHKKGIAFRQGDILYGKLRPYLNNWLLGEFSGLAIGDFWVLRPILFNSPFTYALIQSPTFQAAANVTSGTKMPRSSWSNVSGTNYLVPLAKNEAAAIGKLFSNLGSTIALHERKLDLLKRLKVAYQQQLFPENAKKMPKLRFVGFADYWEQLKLGDVLSERNQLVEKSHDFPLVSFTVENGVTPKTKRYNREQLVHGKKSQKKYKVTIPDDIVYNPANLKFGAISRNKFGNAVLSPIYVTFVVNKRRAIPAFLEYFVTRNVFIQHSLRFQQGTVYERMSVSSHDLQSMGLQLPTSYEQKEIAIVLESLDRVIGLYKHKIEQLKLLKQEFLKTLFV